ncbi:hypothetical protein BDZ85DRAFT_254402 [Elsinoe ampelina]|uniref:Uncharacterized protein n=1 Tax=Elsinoe ampelina TaxID=302913 RepID=A0A6A6GPS2_9PEZI|nr:hypothetical protein BDZ85DRAFT_254402 [Elsinoe ampelina]
MRFRGENFISSAGLSYFITPLSVLRRSLVTITQSTTCATRRMSDLTFPDPENFEETAMATSGHLVDSVWLSEAKSIPCVDHSKNRVNSDNSDASDIYTPTTSEAASETSIMEQTAIHEGSAIRSTSIRNSISKVVLPDLRSNFVQALWALNHNSEDIADQDFFDKAIALAGCYKTITSITTGTVVQEQLDTPDNELATHDPLEAKSACELKAEPKTQQEGHESKQDVVEARDGDVATLERELRTVSAANIHLIAKVSNYATIQEATEAELADQRASVDSLSTDVVNLKWTIEQQTDKLSACEAKNQKQFDEIGDLEAKIMALGERLQKLTTKKQELESEGLARENTRTQLQEALTAEQDRVKTLESCKADLELEHRDYIFELAEQEKRIEKYERHEINRNTKISTLEAEIKNQEAKVKKQEAKVKTQEAKVKQQEAKIKDLEKHAQLDDQEISGLHTTLENQDAEMKRLREDIHTLEDDVVYYRFQAFQPPGFYEDDDR